MLVGLLTAVMSLGAPVSATETDSLIITYLANMGVLLEAGGRRVVIDGFHHSELDGVAKIPADILTALENGTGAFRMVDLALTTHRHLDHFAAVSVAARLGADSAFHFISTAETVDSVRVRVGNGPAVRRLHPITPPVGGRTDLVVRGVRVSALHLPHNPTRRATPANNGYLVRLGDFVVLHVGDADPKAERYAPHRLPAERIDVAILPSWYLTDAADLVRSLIGARVVVASHVSADDTATKARVAASFPGAIVLVAPGERHAVASHR